MHARRQAHGQTQTHAHPHPLPSMKIVGTSLFLPSDPSGCFTRLSRMHNACKNARIMKATIVGIVRMRYAGRAMAKCTRAVKGRIVQRFLSAAGGTSMHTPCSPASSAFSVARVGQLCKDQHLESFFCAQSMEDIFLGSRVEKQSHDDVLRFVAHFLAE
jgi:hypothetical protein